MSNKFGTVASKWRIYLGGFARERRRSFSEGASQLLQQRHSSRLGRENVRTLHLRPNRGGEYKKNPTLMLAFILEERRRCCPPPPPPAPAAAWQAGLVLILPIGMIWSHTLWNAFYSSSIEISNAYQEINCFIFKDGASRITFLWPPISVNALCLHIRKSYSIEKISSFYKKSLFPIKMRCSTNDNFRQIIMDTI